MKCTSVNSKVTSSLNVELNIIRVNSSLNVPLDSNKGGIPNIIARFVIVITKDGMKGIKKVYTHDSYLLWRSSSSLGNNKEQRSKFQSVLKKYTINCKTLETCSNLLFAIKNR